VSKRRKKAEPSRVASVQQVTGHPGPTITTGGKTWRLGFNTQNAKGRLEELIRSQVVRSALQIRVELSSELGEQYWQDAQDSLAAQHYSTFGKGWFRVVKSAIGSKLFLLSLMQRHHPDATEADAAYLLANEPEQTEAALVVIAPDFFHAAMVQIAAEAGKKLDPEAVAALLNEATAALATAST
jgi:hypothetical protein